MQMLIDKERVDATDVRVGEIRCDERVTPA